MRSTRNLSCTITGGITSLRSNSNKLKKSMVKDTKVKRKQETSGS